MKYNKTHTRVIFQSPSDKERVIQTLKLSQSVWNFASERFFELYKRGFSDRKSPIVHRFNEDINEAIRDIFGVDKDFAMFVKRSVLNTYGSLKEGQFLSKPIRTKKYFLYHRFSSLLLPSGSLKLFLLGSKITCEAENKDGILNDKLSFERAMLKFKNDEVYLSVPEEIVSNSNDISLTEAEESSMLSVELPSWLEPEQEAWTVADQDER